MTTHPTLRRLARLVQPKPRLTVSEWAEANAHLPPEGNAEPGKYHGARMPWQPAMMDDAIDPDVNESGWMIAKRMGKSVCVNIITEYFIEHQPSSILVKYPTLDAAKKWIRGQLMKMIKATPCMANLLKEPRQRDSNSSMLDRHFPGGDLTCVGANSPAGLRQVTKRVVLQEEIDADEVSAEGDAVALADGRSETFHNAVKIKTSTPGLKGFSRIEEIFDRSDRQYFHVPCPCCGKFQHLKWAQVKWTFTPAEYKKVKKLGIASPKGSIWVQHRDGDISDTAAAVYVCEHCHGFWNDAMRFDAILSGHTDNPAVKGQRAQWVATAPFKGIRGRHLNGLYRIIGRKKTSRSYLHEFAIDFLTAKSGGRETLRVWVNNFLAETFADPTKQLDWHPLMQRAEEYGPELPVEVVLLLAGLDIHDDRIEIGVTGYGDEEETWGIVKQVVFGDFDLPHIQAQVDDILGQTWLHPSGVRLGITAAGVDSGHKTKAVYRFCKARAAKRIWCLKGASTPMAPAVAPSYKKHYGLSFFIVGTDTLKDAIFSRLEIPEPGPRYIHFPKSVIKLPRDPAKRGEIPEYRTGYDEKYYRGLCSEVIVETFEKGVYKRRYVKKTIRNEPLDLLVYATAAYEILRPNIPRLRASVIPPKPPEGQGGGAAGGTPPKDYVLKLRGEASLPKKGEIPVATPKPEKAPAPERRPQRPRYSGGMFNPLGL